MANVNLKNAQAPEPVDDLSERTAIWLGIKAELVKAGVVSVEMEYAGSCDDGDCEELRFTSAETETKAWGDVPTLVAIREQVEELLLECLSAEFGGWEINEGSWGTITLDVSDGEVSIDHNQRYEESYQDNATVSLEGDDE